MEIGVRDLRNRTTQVIDAVRAGERVVLTVNGEAVADIVPHAPNPRSRWMSGAVLQRELPEWQADAGLTEDLNRIYDETFSDVVDPWEK
jgi:prevent-host-death family protein